MKKVFFSVLMISAMFLVASCGSKSNEAAAETEDESVAKVEFTDPALSFDTENSSVNFDLTDYMSAENCTPPACVGDNSIMPEIATTVTLKITKKINAEFYWAYASVDFCDANGTCLIKSEHNSFAEAALPKMDVGKTMQITLKTESGLNNDQIIKKIAKIRVNLGARGYVKETEGETAE